MRQLCLPRIRLVQSQSWEDACPVSCSGSQHTNSVQGPTSPIPAKMTGASIVFSLNKRVKHDGICWMLCQIKSMHDEADLCRAKAANAVGAAVAGVL